MGRGVSWAKVGCLTAIGLGAILVIVATAAVGVAVRQNRAAAFEVRTVDSEPPAATQNTAASPDPVRLKLAVHTAGISVKPVAAGEPIHIEADYDPRLHAFRQDSERVGRETVMTVDIRPVGSTLMALLRAKLGGRPAMLRIVLPRDVPLEIEGRMDRSFAAMELGGLSLVSTKLDVEEGGVKVSFVEPLAAPMETLSIRGSRGSLSVVGLGNASPRQTRLLQHIGAVDVDLRGAWSRDADVRLIGGAAGGSLWLPTDVRVLGLDARRGIPIESQDEEVPRPTLHLTVSEHMGRFVVMD